MPGTCAWPDEDSPLHGWSPWNGKPFSVQGILHGIKEFFAGLSKSPEKDKSIQKVKDIYQEAMRQLENKREAESQ